MTRSIDLNADLGEGMPWDLEMLARVTSANVSCGAHAGEPGGIAATLREAKRLGVVVGAHPSWPDREGFGRHERAATSEEVEIMVLEQVAFLESLAGPLGAAIRYVKPHGALYTQAMKEEATSAGLIAALRMLDLPLMGLPGTDLERRATEAGLVYVREGFPDRNYRPDGRLVPRGEPDALIEGVAEVAARALQLVESGLDSLCLHGDSPGAVARADAIRAAFEREGIELRSPFASTDPALPD